MTPQQTPALASEQVKACCAGLYASEWVQLLLGDSLHPGGLALSERLAELLGAHEGTRVLDVAAGRGATALHLATTFGCNVLGVDISAANVAQANQAAALAGAGRLVAFEHGDAERLALEDASFDAVICECAFCTFPDKAAAARELYRVLRPGGCLALADLTRHAELPPELEGLLAWVACLAGAAPVGVYTARLEAVGFQIEQVENHDEVLLELVDRIRLRLLAAGVLIKLRGLGLPEVDFGQAGTLARAAESAVRSALLGYSFIVARRPDVGGR